MKSFLLAAVVCVSSAVPAFADTTICQNGRCYLRKPTVVVTDGTQSVLIGGPRLVVTAQEHAEHLAATGTFAHCNRRGGGYEGIGFSTSSPDAAVRRCCYWGRRPAREIGTAWCPGRRGWVAVVRYE